MKRVKNVSLIMLLSIFVFSASVASAQKCSGHEKQHHQGIENLIPDLSDKQKEDIKALRVSNMKEIRGLKDQMDIKRAELKALQNAENADLNAINKKIEEKAAIRTQIEKKSAAHRQAVRALLTDEQKVIYDQKTSHRGKAHKCSPEQRKECGKGHACRK